MIELVFKGRDNPNSVIFKEDGVLIDFSGATRGVVKFAGSDVEADTSVTASLIDFTAGDGKVIFNFNDLVIDSGLYQATFIVYDASHTDGQILISPNRTPNLQFNFLDEDCA